MATDILDKTRERINGLDIDFAFKELRVDDCFDGSARSTFGNENVNLALSLGKPPSGGNIPFNCCGRKVFLENVKCLTFIGTPFRLSVLLWDV